MYFHLQMLALLITGNVNFAESRYTADWNSLDSRPLPSWYDEGKFGIFLHWGVFSVPGFKSAWFWYYWKNGWADYTDFMKQNYPADFTYADFAPMFKAEFYDANEWANIFEASGARYVVLTSKHHEGFTNWPSKVSFNWNSMDVGPKRDLVGELADAIHKKPSLRFGLYHSLFEWFNPLYISDGNNKWQTTEFVDRKAMPELYELVNRYKPEVVWSDGSLGPDWYWKATEFIAWLYNDSPVKDTVVTNDRWGNNSILCHHGGFYTCHDRYNPGHVVNHKWENCMTMDRKAWVYRRNSVAADYLSLHEILTELISTVAYGGNLLLNVGPTRDGRIAPIMEQRLRDIGAWLKVNGRAIYGSRPWAHSRDNSTDVWFTQTGAKSPDHQLFVFIMTWPDSFLLGLHQVPFSPSLCVHMLGFEPRLNVTNIQGVTHVSLPRLSPDQLPCKSVWVLTVEGI